MATLVREVERPAFLDRPAEGQMALGGVASPVREGTAPPAREARTEPLSERLRAERTPAGAAAFTIDATRGGGATLDELLVGAWEGLSARRPVACPICTKSMLPRGGAAGGACGSCGSQLR